MNSHIRRTSLKMEEEITQDLKHFPVCPICGCPLEDIFIDNDYTLLLKTEEGFDEIFLTDNGVFRFHPDEEHPELLHIEWHHQH